VAPGEGAVRAVPVVPLDEVCEAVSTVIRVGEDLQVAALTEHRANPALCFAVGLRVVGTGEAVAHVRCPAHLPPCLGLVGGAVVGEAGDQHRCLARGTSAAPGSGSGPRSVPSRSGVISAYTSRLQSSMAMWSMSQPAPRCSRL